VKECAFFLDVSSCSGCKACQVACQDKHDLPQGVLWRRVYDVEGGGWVRRGGAWIQDVYAYYLSMACNHCDSPICLEVCPSGAITKRPDGVVLLETERCLGCRYCEWACPYGAPQYDAEAGQMTKCTFCADELDAGRPPACVAACPMRALDFGPRRELEARYGPLPAVYPLPEDDPMGPALLLTEHRDGGRAVQAARTAEAVARRGPGDAEVDALPGPMTRRGGI